MKICLVAIADFMILKFSAKNKIFGEMLKKTSTHINVDDLFGRLASEAENRSGGNAK